MRHMTPERWKRIEALFQEARRRPAADRATYLAAACADDDVVRGEVESLLAESASDDDFLEAPAAAMSAHAVAELVLSTMVGGALGPYQLRTLLGVGGMGEVYQAHDPRLGRDVAIKILPRAFTGHPERLARLEREARILASLNHVNICGIYGIEESDGVRFLVLELVEGETLAESLARRSRHRPAEGPLPPREALDVARQIIDALEAAHEKNIIHRDLKPANIKITREGLVKVLDFGLAKEISGDGSSPDLTHSSQLHGRDGHPGAVIGTAAYMSPEQARGLAVDKRTDVWAFGCVLFEMLTGRVAFGGDTVSDSIAKILERDPDWSALPPETPLSIRRALMRCLAKDAKKRLRDVADVRLELDAIDETTSAHPVPASRPRRLWHPSWLALTALVTVTGGAGVWSLARPTVDNPLPPEGFSVFTNWPGSEGHAEISPDGKVVAFLADRDGEIDLYSSQIGTGVFTNLTESVSSLDPVAIQRRLGFFEDSTRLWFGAGPQKSELPWSGGEARPFLVDGAQTPAWSTDGRLVYFDLYNDDALMIADAAGRNARAIPIEWSDADRASHNHNMVWSPDNRYIYFVHGVVNDWNQPTDVMDVWRVAPSGGRPERLTYLNTSVTFLAMLDDDTLLFVAPDENGYGSWLWSLDVSDVRRDGWWRRGPRQPRRIATGLEQYTSVSASRSSGRLVVTRANPAAALWTVPIFDDRRAAEADVTPMPLQLERGLAPRYARHAAAPLLFFLSSPGTGDRVWAFGSVPFQVTAGAEGPLVETPAPSPDGTRVAIVVKDGARRHLAVMNQNGQGSQSFAPQIDIRGAADWSPDGRTIAVAGRDAQGDGLFLLSAQGQMLRRLVSGPALDPAWSPDGDFILYSGVFSGGSAKARGAGAPLLATRPDGTPYSLPTVATESSQSGLRVSPGNYRFIDKSRLVYRPVPEAVDFWLFDLRTAATRQLTQLKNKGRLRGFDVSPDGKHIVFDRVKQNSDIVLIERHP